VKPSKPSPNACSPVGIMTPVQCQLVGDVIQMIFIFRLILYSYVSSRGFRAQPLQDIRPVKRYRHLLAISKPQAENEWSLITWLFLLLCTRWPEALSGESSLTLTFKFNIEPSGA
jgi:hypothetical protein